MYCDTSCGVVNEMWAKCVSAILTLILVIGVKGVAAQSLPYSTDLFLNTDRDWIQVQADILRQRLELRDTYTQDLERVRDKQARDMSRLQGTEDRDARRRARFHAKAERARLRESYRYERKVLQTKIRWARREHTLRRKYSSSAYLILGADDMALDPILPPLLPKATAR